MRSHEAGGLRWELRHPDCRQHGLAKVSNGFSTHCAFPWLWRSCAVDLSSHGHSHLRKLFVWGLPPSVQTLLYTDPNSTESGPKLTKPNQAVTITHPFLKLTQWKGFLIEFSYVSYKINTNSRFRNTEAASDVRHLELRFNAALFPTLPRCPGLTPMCTQSLWGCQDYSITAAWCMWSGFNRAN